MAKSLLRLEARKLREQGVSIKSIARQLHVSKSSVSYWVRDIILTMQQLERLKQSESQGRARGRIKIMLINSERRKAITEHYRSEGMMEVSKLSDRELLLTGIAFYWAEGSKSFRNRRVEFCNSDPRMIKFLMLWLTKCLHVKLEDLRCVVGINQMHKNREEIVKAYWSKVINIPLDQFRKTSFKKVNNKKVYDNFNIHYGTLSISVAKSTNLYYKIMGLIDGLHNGCFIRQRSSAVERFPHNEEVSLVRIQPLPHLEF